MKLRGFLKLIGMFATSSAVPTVIHAIGVTNPVLIGIATAIPTVAALFMKRPQDSDHDGIPDEDDPDFQGLGR